MTDKTIEYFDETISLLKATLKGAINLAPKVHAIIDTECKAKNFIIDYDCEKCPLNKIETCSYASLLLDDPIMFFEELLKEIGK